MSILLKHLRPGLILWLLGVIFTLSLNALPAKAAPVTFEENFDGTLARKWMGVPAKDAANGSLLMSGSESTRLTSISKFRCGRYSVQLKFNGMGANNYAYIGFMSRDPWAANVVWAVLDSDNRLHLQVRRNSGEVAQPGVTPVATPDVWHTLVLDWTPTEVRMEWDGEVSARMSNPDQIPTDLTTSIMDIVPTGPAGFTVEARALKIEGGEIRTPVRREVGILPPLRLPPTTTQIAWPKRTAPRAVIQGNSAIAENAFYRMKLSWNKGLQLEDLYNNVTKASCLETGSSSQFFSITEGDKILRSSDFTVTKKSQSSKGETSVLYLVAQNAASGWEVHLTQTVDASPEVRLKLELVNKSERQRTATILWPHISGLQIGNQSKDNYYLFPYVGGWSNNHPIELGSMYGQSSGFFQLFTLFNPALGSSVYLYFKDQSGRDKTMSMRKLEKGAYLEDLDRYVSIPVDQRPAKGSLTETTATQFAMGHNAMVFEAGQRRAMPELILAVSPGDWHQAFRSYSTWAHSWMKNPTLPAWYKKESLMNAVHDIGGNIGYETGFLKDGQWNLGEIAKPGSGIAEVVFWWQHILPIDGETVKTQRWRRLDMGEYKYWQDIGGQAALRREIEECHRKGVRVSLYTTPRFAWEGTDIYKKHPDWVLKRADGSLSNDWTSTADGVTMRQYDLCYSVPEWRQMIADTAGRIVRDTGCDGIFMDTMNEALPCYNPLHKHPESPALLARPMLEAYRKAIKTANPEAYMSAENVCAEHLTQYIDGTLIKTFATSEVPQAQEYDLYALHFARFYFPEIKYFEWGSRFEDGARRAFFNGVGYMRGEMHGARDLFTGEQMSTEGNLKYLADTSRIMAENVDAFTSLHPEPYVPTLVAGVYANKFPGTKQTVWTIYNRAGKNLDTNVITVPHIAGAIYIELMHGKTLKPTIKNGMATIKMSFKNGEVLALAQRAPGFKAQKPASAGNVRQAALPER